MKEHDDPLEDTLLSVCREFLRVASLTGNCEENSLNARFSAIVSLWEVRMEKTKDPSFPFLDNYIPIEQWRTSTTIFRQQQIRFVGALADYIYDRRER